MPEWINDRNPNSPGIYITNKEPDEGFITIKNLLCYFDGTKWLYPHQIGAASVSAEHKVEWMKIELGKD